MKAVIFIHVLYIILIKILAVNGDAKCESKIELRAVLLSCPPKDSGCDDDDPLAQAMKSEEYQILETNSKSFETMREEKGKGYPNAVRDCKRKLVITLRVKNIGKIPCDDEYIVVDHVFDPVTGGRGRLLSPVVVKLRQEQMIQLYGLQFQRVVNSDPFEEQKAADKTCSVDPENPTCGIAMYDGNPIPFSEGFCCSCDPHVNAKRQLSPVSHGDAAFQYRDSNLISQKNTRFFRSEDKISAIVNPELIRLKSSSSEENGQENTDSGMGDPFSWNKIPNFLMEHDRKIICDQGDFMNELCRLREDKNQGGGGGDAREKNFSEDASGRSDGTLAGVGAGGEGEVDPDEAKLPVVSIDKGSREGKRHFANVRDSETSEIFADKRMAFERTRGKRENQKEKKEFSLEEKLEKFIGSKSYYTKRRKRLLELTHKRFRKAQQESTKEQENTSCRPDKSTLPKYFFTHDKVIIDPLISPEQNHSGTNKKSKDCKNENGVKDGEQKGTKKSQNKDETENFEALYDMKDKTETDIKTDEYKDKCYLDKLADKQERVTHNEGGRIENNVGKSKLKVKILKETEGNEDLPKDGRRVEENGKLEEITLKKEGDGEDFLNERINEKNFKNFIFENANEKKVVGPRIRNFLMARTQKKQKFRTEMIKNQKKEKLQPRKENSFEDMSNQESLKKNEVVNDDHRAEKNKLEDNRGENFHVNQQDNEESLKNFKILQNSDSAGNSRGKELTNDLRKYSPNVKMQKMGVSQNIHAFQSQGPKKKAKMGRFDGPKTMMGDVDFNVEIIRSSLPELTKHRHLSSSADQTLKNRFKAPTETLESKLYDILENNVHMKNRQNHLLYYRPQQKYYLIGNERNSPHDLYLIQGANGRFAEMKNRHYFLGDPMTRLSDQFQSNSQHHKRPLAHYYVPVPEFAFGEAEQPVPRRSPETEWRGQEYLSSFGREDGSEARPGSRASTRTKRSVFQFFEPAKGFLGSESKSDLKKAEKEIVHVLETCLPAERAKESEDAEVSKDELFGWKFPEAGRGNASGFGPPAAGSTKRRRAVDEERLFQSYLRAPEYVFAEVEEMLDEKREAGDPRKGSDARGSQSCGNDTFSGEYTQDTAHCMRFGDLWYSMYQLKRPVVAQIVGIQLFNKHSLSDGTTQWRDLTKGKMIRLGTLLPKAEDELPTISMSFLGRKTEKIKSAINPDNYLLLIPSHVSDPAKANSYPQFAAGPEEYMLVQTKDVSSGGDCNMVGTSFEAFARQPDRCAQRKGSCLKRQPVDLWREDMEARIRGKRGKYFVENFGAVPTSPIKTYTNLSGEFLALEYYGEYMSTIEIEVKADSNAIVRKGSNAQIPLVYTDATYPKKARIVLSVLNLGLTSSYFRPRLGDCPPDLDPAWCPLEGPLVIIPPQQRHDFKLDLSGALPNGEILMTVQVLNQNNQKVAQRKIEIKKGNRCVCAFHCKCNCIGNLYGGRTCRKLSLEDYRKAGYPGSYPFRGGAAVSSSESLWGNIHIVFLTATYVLLFLGVMKGILGIFWRRLGISGVRIVTGPRQLFQYYESELEGCTVLFDEYGFPVHPTSCKPVQIVPIWLEMLINFLFFFLYPLRGIRFLLLSLPCCVVTCNTGDGCPREEGGDPEHRSSHPLLSKTPQPTCVHYNLTTINAKKSKQDEYPSYLPYKGEDDPLEEDDTEFVLQEMKRYRKK